MFFCPATDFCGPCAEGVLRKCRFADKERTNDFRVLTQISAKIMTSWPCHHSAALPQGLASRRGFIATESCHNRLAYSYRTFWFPKVISLDPLGNCEARGQGQSLCHHFTDEQTETQELYQDARLERPKSLSKHPPSTEWLGLCLHLG